MGTAGRDDKNKMSNATNGAKTQRAMIEIAIATATSCPKSTLLRTVLVTKHKNNSKCE